MEVAGLQVIPLPPLFPLQIHRSTLELVQLSIAPSTINDIKTTEVPWFLVPKVILWFHRCQRLHQLLGSLNNNPVTLTANECRDSTTEVPLNLRTQESPGASLNAWGIGESSCFIGELGVSSDHWTGAEFYGSP
jgi:hypothetical protein